MKSFTTSAVARGAWALAGAVTAVMLAAGGAAAAGPGQSPHRGGGQDSGHRGGGQDSWSPQRSHLRHQAPRWARHRPPTRHVGVWQHRPVR